MPVDRVALEIACADLLIALGEDASREGLRETPQRFARAWADFIEYDAGNHETTFEAVHADQMVVVKGIEVTSVCEHHLLPFTCTVAIAYITNDRVLGLSKFARIAHLHAHKLQLQERLTKDIAEHVKRLVQTDNVAVVVTGSHTCMTTRGIKTSGTMYTSVLSGAFRDGQAARAELFSLLGKL